MTKNPMQSVGGLLGNPLFMMGTGLLSNQRDQWGGALQGLAAAQGYKLSEERMRLQREQEERQRQIEEMQIEAAKKAKKRQEVTEGLLATMGIPQVRAAYSTPQGQDLLRPHVVANADPAQLEAAGILSPLPKQADPTSLQRNLEAMGIDPASPMGQQIMLQSMLKPRTEVNVGADIPNPPQGYWYNDPNNPGAGIYPMPGSPQAAEADTARTAARESMRQRVARIDGTMAEVDRAISMTNWKTAGLVGAVAKEIPATDARTLRGALMTIKANIGFNELQAMREASKTGGALGQVAIQELERLEAVLGSLDQAMEPIELINGLQKVQTHYSNWRKAVTEALAEAPAVVPSSSPAQQAGGDKKAEINRLRAEHGLPAIP